MKVLVYTRPRIKAFFHALAKNISSFQNVTFMSDHKGEEELWIMKYFYHAKEDIIKKGAKHKTELNIEAVIRRCRYLRYIEKDEANLIVLAMTLAVERIIDQYKPDIVFGMVMDSYVLDIFDLVMRTRNSQYIGFLNNMINGYSRLTSRGELFQLRELGSDEVNNALVELTSKSYVPNMQNDFMWKTTPGSMFFTKYLKEKLKIVYYYFKKIIDKDPNNFYYNTVASSHCMSCRSIEQLFYRKYQENLLQEKIDKAKKDSKVIAYLPLQFYPECSLDYWGTNKDYANFYKVISSLLENDYKNVLIISKEHPSATGLRKTEFYKQFSLNENVILAPFDTPSNNLIDIADVVITWTGSVGVEAIMRDKPLISFGEAYYDPGYGISRLDNFLSFDKLEEKILSSYKNIPVDESIKFDVVEHTLKGLVPGYVFPLDYGTKKNPVRVGSIEKLGLGVDECIKRLHELGTYKAKNGCI